MPPNLDGKAYMCVECGAQVKSLYREYSKESIRLTRCDKCGSVADKYIEFEMVLVVLDAVLHKVQAYRHLLFNRPHHRDLDISALVRMATALVVLDTHVKYAFYVYSEDVDPSSNMSDRTQDQIYLVVQILLFSILEHIVFAVGLVVAAGLCQLLQCALYPLVGRLLLVFVLVWDQQPIVSDIISVLVMTSQWLALQAVLGPPPSDISASQDSSRSSPDASPAVRGPSASDDSGVQLGWAPGFTQTLIGVSPVAMGHACRCAVRLVACAWCPNACPACRFL